MIPQLKHCLNTERVILEYTREGRKLNQQNGMIQQLMNCLLNHPIRARSKKKTIHSINRESTRTAICQKTLLSIINQSLRSKRFLKQTMAGEFRLHQLFSEIEKEAKLIQEE